MNRSLEGKVALVTGASRGLGRGIALDLAAQGALVAINYARNEVAARETLAMIEDCGGAAFLAKGELGSLEAARDLAQTLHRELSDRNEDGGIDILINNAGGGVMATIEGTTPEILEKTFADNVTGPFYLTQVLMARLRQGGRVVNMSSKGATSALPQYIIYAMCKSAVETFTIALAKELGPRGITVNCIVPGLITSDSNADIRANPVLKKFMEENTLIGRLGMPSDIAAMVNALVSPALGFVTAQVIEVSGGLFMAQGANPDLEHLRAGMPRSSVHSASYRFTPSGGAFLQSRLH